MLKEYPPCLPFPRRCSKPKCHSTIYSTLRRREPNGCDEKELVGRVFHTSTSADKGARGDATGPVFAGGVGGGGGGVGGGGLAGAAIDGSDNHPFSKTKVRGAVTLLKFAQVSLNPSWIGRGKVSTLILRLRHLLREPVQAAGVDSLSELPCKEVSVCE